MAPSHAMPRYSQFLFFIRQKKINMFYYNFLDMKSFKSIGLFLAGVLIAIATFSFKYTVSQNEFLVIILAGRISVYSNGQKIHEEKGTVESISIILDKYGKEGWTLKTTCSPGAWTGFYLERAKQ
ncbi:MAG: hypothetical protein K2X86_14975 [Cytophagaceae bacterium]|nr:hypothetical protein [Cytophagaceae bacterium]